MKVMAIVNPVAGMGRGERCGREIIKSVNDLDVVFTTPTRTATDLARQAISQGYRRVIAVGGDGTIQQVVNGLAAGQASLAVIPAGCGNDFSKALGIPQNTKEALAVALKGRVVPIDLGTVDGNYFVNVVSFGLDAKLNQRVPAMKNKCRILPASGLYAVALLQELCSRHIFYPEVRVKFWEAGIERIKIQPTTVLAVSNGPQYGGMFQIAPSASLTDGLLDICWIGKMNRREIIVNLPKIILGTHEKLPQVRTLRLSGLIVEANVNLVCQIDGEIVSGRKRYEIRAVPRGLEVVVPQKETILLTKVPAFQPA
jgi:diacylglycerol kinase (ATP)